MRARTLSGWLLGASLLILSSGPGPHATEALDIGLAAPDAPDVLVLDPERPVTVAADSDLLVPALPDVLVEVPAAESARTETAKQEPAKRETVAPAVTVATVDPLPAAIEARLADPKLPLPPKLSRRDRESLSGFYAVHGFRPVWIAGGAWTPAARAVAARLGRADEDGLDPADYPVPNLAAGAAPLGAAELAEAELKLGAVAFLYARDARGGRLDLARISGLITPKLTIPTPEAVLSGLAGSADPDAALASYQPAYPGYRALRDKLASLRANRPAGPLVYGPARSGPALASVDPSGIKAPSTRLEGDIVANMERWRWLPVDVATRAVVVNVPEYRLRLIEDGRVTHETRVITGRATTPTPIFSGTMDHAIVNPSWYIPPSIMKKEILPGLEKDPDYASRRGYEVVRRGKAVSVRQPPGPRNALGYIKFMFPNDHAVYLHDTPSRNLFASSQRAMSHGCVRVENPFAFGGRILGAAWSEARLKSLVGYGERTITLTEKLPVHLTYFTVSIDEAGEVRTFDDIYGYHRRIRAALGLGA